MSIEEKVERLHQWFPKKTERFTLMFPQELGIESSENQEENEWEFPAPFAKTWFAVLLTEFKKKKKKASSGTLGFVVVVLVSIYM